MISRRSLLVAAGSVAVSTGLPAQGQSRPRVTVKKGLAGAAPSASKLATRWYYDWSLHPSTKGMPADDPCIHFHPMVWGVNGNTNAALAALRGHSLPVLFGFNEPDHRDQSNLTVEKALDIWPKLQGIATELVSPSCAQPDRDWMKQFADGAAKRGLHFDAVGVHHYGSADPHDLIGLLQRVHNLYQRPIWVTEFAVADWKAHGGVKNRYSERDAIRYIQTVCPFMDKTSWIRGYAWYPWGKPGQGGPLSASAFFQPDGTLTDVGEAYAAV